MSITLPVAAAEVLITSPGPQVSETVHQLLGQGARVTIEASDDPAVAPLLADLAGRGLATVETGPDPRGFAVTLRDPGLHQAAPEPAAASGNNTGRVTLVGGGPGDLGLLTIAGLEALRTADVIVTDRLAPLSALAHARPDAEVIHVGKIPRGAFTPQEEINRLLVEHARAGRDVVRLKGGDSFVFGRGGEEWNACVEAGLPVHVIPGVTSSVAVPALAGIPVTHRGLSQGFVVVSGHVAPGDERSDVSWASLATSGLTIVLLMGIAALPEISAALVAAGLDPQTPAACVADGGMPSQREVRDTVSTIAVEATAAGLTPPAITIIGRVVGALTPQ